MKPICLHLTDEPRHCQFCEEDEYFVNCDLSDIIHERENKNVSIN